MKPLLTDKHRMIARRASEIHGKLWKLWNAFEFVGIKCPASERVVLG